MDDELSATIHAVVQRAPQWLRHDLASGDPATRLRAEETMAAMLADALGKTNLPDQPDRDL
jgi:hypothetical protein